MQMRGIKIAFFDVDGTLLPLGVKEPSDKTIYTLKELQKKVLFFAWLQGEVFWQDLS